MSTGLLATIERYMTKYVTFSSPDYSFAVALWTVGTYLWERFDSFPYLVITSDTKRSGKTRLSEIIGFMAHQPRPIAAATPAVILRFIRDEKATIFFDEAEKYSSESASLMRQILNVGYRRGQTVPRVNPGHDAGVTDWPAYCPKGFILIGDVYDTLRDRSVVVRMRRAEVPQRFLYTQAQGEGQGVRDAIVADLETLRDAVAEIYNCHDGLPFLGDRDEEIWLPLFAIASVLAPDRVEELKRVAVDVATEKTAPSKNVKGLQDAESAAMADEYRIRLLRDMCAVVPRDGHLLTEDVLATLKALPVAPWRKFRGVGLTAHVLGDMLQPLGVRPRNIRLKGMKNTVRKGYKGSEVHAAAIANNVNLNEWGTP